MNERKQCHNCRRRRLRCDWSVPTCVKCSKTGQRCLGYGQLYRWVDSDTAAGGGADTNHGKKRHTLAPHTGYLGLISESRGLCAFAKVADEGTQQFVISLADPLVQDLNGSSRRYMSYFASRFCQDLVVYDSAELGTNPFRELIPMSQTYPHLQQIIIAVSAVHYYNAVSGPTAQKASSSHVARAMLVDALYARQKAIRGLINIIQLNKSSDGREESQADQDALLATVLFFVNFTLIDSGKEEWQNHLTAAGRLLSIHGLSTLSLAHVAGNYDSALLPSESRPHPSVSSTYETISSIDGRVPLSACDYVASDTVAYLIWNCALVSLVSTTSSHQTTADRSHEYASQLLTWDFAKVLRILSRTEANSYHSCPAYLMTIVLRTAQITQLIKASGRRSPDTAEMNEYLRLLREAETFDVEAWASRVSTHVVGVLGVTDEHELDGRRHIAAAYRAAVCLYIWLVAPGIPGRRHHQRVGSFPTSEGLVSTILRQLSCIRPSSPLFKFTVWPVFLTGVDAVSDAHRRSVTERLAAMRDLCPWGMLTSALETLREIWGVRDEVVGSGDKGTGKGMDGDGESREKERDEWLERLRGLRIDCLIV
ncbi:hypothetical protein F5Y17DRAFT_142007 [Xylariaceae sp. FL0594]|nr:hypothetical protein F5Y17DRAFT_142007 [Xylariaceae sp. FL0594]